MAMSIRQMQESLDKKVYEYNYLSELIPQQYMAVQNLSMQIQESCDKDWVKRASRSLEGARYDYNKMVKRAEILRVEIDKLQAKLCEKI